MRLGFRKAGRGSNRGKSWKAKINSALASAPTTSGICRPWPPLSRDEIRPGRGGRGTGGGRCGAAPADAFRAGRA
jgi:hypothetical protein